MIGPDGVAATELVARTGLRTRAGTPVEPVMPELAALTGNHSQAPVPFDPR